MGKRTAFFLDVHMFPRSWGNNRRVKGEGGEATDRRARKGAVLFSVPFAGLHSRGLFPLRRVRVCKQANNNRAVKAGRVALRTRRTARGIAPLVLPACKTFVFLLTN